MNFNLRNVKNSGAVGLALCGACFPAANFFALLNDNLMPNLGIKVTDSSTTNSNLLEIKVTEPFIKLKVTGDPSTRIEVVGESNNIEQAITTSDLLNRTFITIDVSKYIGKTIRIRLVGHSTNSYITADAISLTKYPAIKQGFSGRNSFICFTDQDPVGRKFQQIYSTPEGRNNRDLADYCVTQVVCALSSIAGSINRDDLAGCKRIFHDTVKEIIERYRVTDKLSQGYIGANASANFTANLVTYDLQQANEWNSFTSARRISLRQPATVLRRGKTTCGGISALENVFGNSLPEFGLKSFVVGGYTRPVGTLIPDSLIDHSWVDYKWSDGQLEAPSDTSNTISPLNNSYKLLTLRQKEKLGQHLMVVVDPYFRDVFHLFRYAGNRVDIRGKNVEDDLPNLSLDYKQWVELNNTHSSYLNQAKKIFLKSINEDVAKVR